MRDIITPYLLQYDVGYYPTRARVAASLTAPLMGFAEEIKGHHHVIGKPFRLILPKNPYGYWFLGQQKKHAPVWHLYDYSFFVAKAYSYSTTSMYRIEKHYVAACGRHQPDTIGSFKRMPATFKRRDYRKSLDLCPECVRALRVLLRQEAYLADFQAKQTKPPPKILSDAEYAVERLKEQGEIPWYDL